MVSLVTAVLVILATVLPAAAGQLGFKTSDWRAFPPPISAAPASGVLLNLSRVPTCTACKAYLEFRQDFDEDGLDPHFPGEDTLWVAVQLGKQRSGPRGQAGIQVVVHANGHTEAYPLVDPTPGLESVQVTMTVLPDTDRTVIRVDIRWFLDGVEQTGQHFIHRPTLGMQVNRAIMRAVVSSSTATPFCGRGHSMTGWRGKWTRLKQLPKYLLYRDGDAFFVQGPQKEWCEEDPS